MTREPGTGTYVVVVSIADRLAGAKAHIERTAVADIGGAGNGVSELVEDGTATDVAGRHARAAAETRSGDLVVEDRAEAVVGHQG